MPPQLRHRLSPGAAVEEADEGLVVSTAAGARLVLTAPAAGQRAAVTALRGDGASEALLCDTIARGDGPAAIPWLFLLLTRAGRLALVETALTESGADYAVLQPFSANYQIGFRAAATDRPAKLSRFAYLRALDGALVLESPRAHVRMRLSDPRAVAFVAALAEAQPAGEIAVEPRDKLLLTLLAANGFLEETRHVSEEEEKALEEWEFHDLLFHGRSRAGRHLYPWGATYRWTTAHEPLPAVKPMTGEAIPLFRPDLATLAGSDPSFGEVLEGRRSRRTPGPDPLTIEQLGTLLFRTARVRGRTRTDHEEVSSRPYPGGGADYELEIYPVVHRVAGLDAGIYHYHPLEHALYRIGDSGPQHTALLRDAAQKAQMQALPDVLLCLSGRFRRLSFKYSSIAYAVMLKDIGALYQTFYLASTAMGLAPCALGGGDIELFARATGLSPLIEPSVGEFMVSGASEFD